MLHKGKKIPYHHFLILFCEMGVSCGFIFSTKASNFISTFNQSKRRQKFLPLQEFLGRSRIPKSVDVFVISFTSPYLSGRNIINFSLVFSVELAVSNVNNITFKFITK